MKKGILLFLMIAVLLITGVAVIYRLSPIRTLVDYSKYKNQLSDINVEVSTDIPGFTIPRSSTNLQSFRQLLAALGYTGSKQPFIGYRINPLLPRELSLKTVRIRILDLVSYDLASHTADANRILFKMNDTIIFMAGELSEQNTVLTIPLYIAAGQLNTSLRPLETVVNELAITAVYFNFQNEEISKLNEPLQFVDEHVGSNFPHFFQFSRSASKSLFWNMFHILIPTAYAQCTGTYLCGAVNMYWQCSGGPYNGSGCQFSSDCSGGSCKQVMNTCDTNGAYGGNCDLVNSQCGPLCGSCVLNRTCGGSAATPTPQPACIGPCMGVGGCPPGFPVGMLDITCHGNGINNRCCRAPASCTVGSWVNGACGVGGCAATDRLQTRTTNPAGCAISSQCIADATCILPPPVCTCGGWANNGCGSNGCPGNMQGQSRSCNPGGCAATIQCAADGACGGSSCSCGAWTDAGCGGGGCPGSQMLQTRGCNPGGCSFQTQCVPNAACTPMTINVRAKLVSTTAFSCADIASSTNYINGEQFSLSPAGAPATQSQNNGNYVTWNNLVFGSYTINYTPVPAYSVQNSCWTKNPGGTSGQGLSISGVPGDVFTIDLGFSPTAAWPQVQGGDALVCKDVKSHVFPGTAIPYFNDDGSGGFPGLVSYSTSFDFQNGANTGENMVSTKNWLARDTPSSICATNWYQYFYNRFDMAPKAQDYGAGALSEPPTRLDSNNQPIPYKVGGNATVSNWNISNNQSLVIFVNGNLTIDGDIKVNPGGFLAFIVSGNIIVTSNVGQPQGSSAANIEGIYIAGGTFMTGTSTQVNLTKLIVHGTVVANDFLLQRDISETGGSNDIPAERFEYYPDLLMNLPDQFKDIKVKWSEVAP